MKKKVLSIAALCLMVSLLAAALTACLPRNTEAARKKLEKAGYEVLYFSKEEKKVFDYLADDFVDGFTAYNSKTKGEIGALEFKNEKAAKKAESVAKDYVEYYYGYSNYKVVVKGKWILVGNDEGFKAFKK